MGTEKCENCQQIKPSSELKCGWTNALYCSYSCELSSVSHLHGTMPGGSLPRRNWVPHHIGLEIERRWAEE